MDGLSDGAQGVEIEFHGVAPGIRHGGDGTQCEGICSAGLRGQRRPIALSILNNHLNLVDDRQTSQDVHVVVHVHHDPTLGQVGSAAAQPGEKRKVSLTAQVVSAHALEPTGWVVDGETPSHGQNA